MEGVDIKKIDELKSSPMFNLSLSSKELFHTNFMYWLSQKFPYQFIDLMGRMLEEENNKEENNQFLTDLKELKRNNKLEFKREYNHFDFSILTKEDNPKTVLVLENKVKSIATRGQLKGYEDKAGSGCKFILLSLTDPNEKVLGVSPTDPNKKTWTLVKYKDYAVCLQDTILKSNKLEHYERELIEDYVQFISNLSDLADIWQKDWELGKTWQSQDSEALEMWQDIRIYDIYEKLRVQSFADEVIKELKRKLKDKGEDGKILDVSLLLSRPKKAIEEDKKHMYKPQKLDQFVPGYVYVKSELSHGQGLVDACIRCKLMDENNNPIYRTLYVQIQGNNYRRAIDAGDLAKKGVGDITKAMGYVKDKERLNFDFDCDRDKRFFGENSTLYPKEKNKKFNNFNDFKYRYKMIPADKTIEDVLKFYVGDIMRILGLPENKS